MIFNQNINIQLELALVPQDTPISNEQQDDTSQPVEYQGDTALVEEYHCDTLLMRALNINKKFNIRGLS